VVVRLERQCVRRHNTGQLVFRAERDIFPLGLSYLFLPNKRTSWKALGLADRCGLLFSSLCAKRTICFDVKEPCIFPTGPECTVLYSTVQCTAKVKEINPRIVREVPDNVLIFSIFCALIRSKSI